MHGALSPREWQAAGLVADGLTNNAIAEVTGLSPHTIKTYVANACRKVGVANRTGLAAWYATQKSNRPVDWGFSISDLGLNHGGP
ncbi:MAG: helix-turn-helix transcriptional regulator [Dehalococcoidia bacterium]|nr:helix-turn-helix transcriptional regulator [Dehalococcoidia bacterium]